MIAIPPIAQAFLKREEGCVLHSYADSGGTLTIGCGHTGGVRVGETCTEEQADEWLASDLQKAVYRLTAATKPTSLEALNTYEQAALTSFAFNVGIRSNWPICAEINAVNRPGILEHLALYVRDAAGDIVQGLVNRRAAERALFLGQDPLCAQYSLAGPSAATHVVAGSDAVHPAKG